MREMGNVALCCAVTSHQEFFIREKEYEYLVGRQSTLSHLYSVGAWEE
jgi:hypothetical protein